MSLILTLSLLSMLEIITGLYIGGMFGVVFITGGISGIMVIGIILVKKVSFHHEAHVSSSEKL